MRFEQSEFSTLKQSHAHEVPSGSAQASLHSLHDKSLQKAESLERDRRREELFQFFVASKMIVRFEDDLDALDFPQEIIDTILESTAHSSYEELFRALSYPYETRKVYLAKIRERIERGELKAEETVSTMARTAAQYGFSVGFHMSKYEIRPSGDVWTIRGLEPDDRDDDKPMAYYSREFKWLYRRKLSNYLYIVRANDSDQVGADGKWWRAPSLSIVQRISGEELDVEMLTLDRELAQRTEDTPQRIAAE